MTIGLATPAIARPLHDLSGKLFNASQCVHTATEVSSSALYPLMLEYAGGE